MNDDDDQSDSARSDELADALVRLGRSERPPPDARRRALRAALTGVVLGVPAKSAALAASVTGGTSGSVTAAGAATGSLLIVAKWGAVGALSATALFGAAEGAVTLLQRGAKEHSPASPALVTGTGRRAADREPSSDQLPTVPPIAQPEREAAARSVKRMPRDTARIAPRVVVSSPARPARAVFEDPRASQLTAELQILDAARSALAAGRVSAALSHLNRHAAEFSPGILNGEADAIRIDALVKAGAIADAERLAREFLAVRPNSPLCARVRALVPSAASPGNVSAIGSGSSGHSFAGE